MQKKLLALFLLGLAANSHEVLSEETLEAIAAPLDEELKLNFETEDVLMIKAPPSGFLGLGDNASSETLDTGAIVESIQDVVRPLSEKIGAVFSWVTGDGEHVNSVEDEKVGNGYINREETLPCTGGEDEERRGIGEAINEEGMRDENEVEGSEERMEIIKDNEVEGFEEYEDDKDQGKVRSFLRVAVAMKDELEVTDDMNQEERIPDAQESPIEEEDDMDQYDTTYLRVQIVEAEEDEPDFEEDDYYEEGDYEFMITNEQMKAAMNENEEVEETNDKGSESFYQRLVRMFGGGDRDDEGTGKNGYYDGL